MSIFSALQLAGLFGDLFEYIRDWKDRKEYRADLRHERNLLNTFEFAKPIVYQPITRKLNGKLLLKWYSWDRNPNSYQNQVNLTACSSIIKSEFLINSSEIPKRGIYS